MALNPPRPTASTLAAYPIPIELITSLYRANDGEFGQLLSRMPEYGRARVAAYCTERDRLHHIGLKIARTCAEPSLIQAAGAEVGADLFAQSRAVDLATH